MLLVPWTLQNVIFRKHQERPRCHLIIVDLCNVKERPDAKQNLFKQATDFIINPIVWVLAEKSFTVGFKSGILVF